MHFIIHRFLPYRCVNQTSSREQDLIYFLTGCRNDWIRLAHFGSLEECPMSVLRFQVTTPRLFNSLFEENIKVAYCWPFVRGRYCWPLVSAHKSPGMWKAHPWHNVTMDNALQWRDWRSVISEFISNIWIANTAVEINISAYNVRLVTILYIMIIYFVVWNDLSME